MNTKIILTSSAIILGLIGLVLTFLPQETLQYFNREPNSMLILITQITGAFYFAFAMLNWMSKGALMGGIYNRPVAVANLTHFMIAGLALLKSIAANSDLPVVVYVLALIYTIYGLVFAFVLFRHPANKNDKQPHI